MDTVYSFNIIFSDISNIYIYIYICISKFFYRNMFPDNLFQAAFQQVRTFLNSLKFHIDE